MVLSFIVIACGAGYYFYNKYLAANRWKPILQKELAELVLKTSDSLYHIEYSDFDLNIRSGNATLRDFKMVPDTNVYNKLVALKKAPDKLFILSVKKLSITNIGAREAYKNKILNIDNISIDKPDLTIISKRYDFNKTVKVGKPKTPYAMIKSVFKQLHIDSVSLTNISLNYINKDKGGKQSSLKNVDIGVSDIFIDSLSGDDPKRFYYTKGIDITIRDYNIKTPDSLYQVGLKKLYFSTAEKKIVLDKVAFTPRYNHADFYNKKGSGGDIYNLKFKQIAINGIDLQSIFRDQFLYAETIDLGSPNIGIYSDNSFKGKKTSKIGKDPHQALQNAPLSMNLKRINIKNAKISYSETDAKSGATGVILFTHTNATITNATNDDDAKKLDPYMVASIDTRFMDVAKLHVGFKFNLNAKDGAFNYWGELDNLDGKKLDKLVKPLAMVHVESADIKKLAFNINASNYTGKGHVEFYYKNLKIQLLKKVDGKTELQSQDFVSKLANNLIIDDDNPDKKGFRPGPVDMKREPTVSFFSFLYKGILEGIKPSVGLDKKTEAKLTNTAKGVSSLFGSINEYKATRKQKKAEEKKQKQAKQDSINKAKQKGN